MKIINISLIIFSFIMLTHCATVPMTGRKQLSMVSNAEIIPMSIKEYQKVIKESKLSTDAQQVEMI